MLLAISFISNISEHVGKQLNAELKIAITSDEAGIRKAVEYIKDQRPSKVIALGMYSGKDNTYCRLELSCSSRFRNTGINKKLSMNSWLSSNSLKYANSIGNSWCNKLSYEITTKYPMLPFSFVHIPKSYKVDGAVESIRSALDDS